MVQTDGRRRRVGFEELASVAGVERQEIRRGVRAVERPFRRLQWREYGREGVAGQGFGEAGRDGADQR